MTAHGFECSTVSTLRETAWDNNPSFRGCSVPFPAVATCCYAFCSFLLQDAVGADDEWSLNHSSAGIFHVLDLQLELRRGEHNATAAACGSLSVQTFQTLNSGNLGSLGLKLRWNFEALSNRSRSSKTQSKRNSFNAASGTAGISSHGSQIRWIWMCLKIVYP